MNDVLTRLIEAEKASVAPPPGVKEATWSALTASIESGAVIDLSPGMSVAWIAGIIGGATGLVVAVVVATRPAVEVAPLPPPPPPVIVVEPIAPPPPPPIKKVKRARRPSLALQIAELRKAQLAFSRGNSEQALQLVEEHRRRFPKTALEQERSALEALAACRIKRGDASSLSRSFLERWPSSPQADRVRTICGL